MLSLVHSIAGRPWAVHADLAAQIHGILSREGFAGLRSLAAIKREIHAFDDGERNERLEARRGQRAAAAGGGVAVVPIIGTLTQRTEFIDSVATRSTAEISEEVAAAVAEPKVDAVVLEVDSPGGEVFGTPEAFAAIRAAAKQKPIVASVNSFTASAAFYLAAAANEIVITPSGLVGSVGVYMLHVDASKALEEIGERWEFVVADESPFKVEGNPTGPLTDEGRADLQSMVNHYMDMFVRDLAKGRGVPVDQVRGNFGKGRMVRPQEAVNAKMVDRVGTLDAAIERAAALARERRQGAAPAAASDVAGDPDAAALARLARKRPATA